MPEPGLPVSPSEFYDLVRETVKQELKKQGRAGLIKAKVASTAGAIELPGETSTTRGPKTMLQVQPSALVVDDPILVSYDTHDNYLILGKLVAPAAFAGGLSSVIPGTTVRDSANTERFTVSTSFVTIKRFWPGFAGSFRITLDLWRDVAIASTATARIIILTASGDIIVASANATETGSSPASKTLDMTGGAEAGMEIGVQYKTSDGSNAAYIKNVVIKYDVATTNPTINHAVLQD